MSQELKACPLCGKVPLLYPRTRVCAPAIHCGCGVTFSGGPDDASCVAAWNSRVPSPASVAPPPPAPAQAGWTDAQREAAWEFHLRTRGYTVDLRPTREMICGQLAEIAPLFAPKVRVKLPERLPIEPGMRPETFERRTTYNQAVEACAAAIRAAGAEIEGEPAS